MNHIYSRLSQGCQEDALRARFDPHIDLVVYLGQEICHELSHESLKPVVHVPLNDGWNPDEKLQFILYVLQAARAYNTLLACRYGVSRSPAISILWLKEAWGYSYHRSVEMVKERVGANFNPVPDLLSCIKNYERSEIYERCRISKEVER